MVEHPEIERICFVFKKRKKDKLRNELLIIYIKNLIFKFVVVNLFHCQPVM